MQVDGVIVVFGSILLYGFSEEPGLLTQTLKQDDLIFDDEIIFPYGKWIIRIEKSNFPFY